MDQIYYILLQNIDADNNYQPGAVIGLFSTHGLAYFTMEKSYQKILKGVLADIEAHPDFPDTSSYYISKGDAKIQTSETQANIYNWEIIEVKVISTSEDADELLEGEE